jgi:hypothetical protein
LVRSAKADLGRQVPAQFVTEGALDGDGLEGKFLDAGTDDELHVKIFDFKTHQWSELAQKGNVESWEWSKDSRYIYIRRVKGDPGVFRVSVKGGGMDKICDLKGWHDAGWFGKYMGLDPHRRAVAASRYWKRGYLLPYLGPEIVGFVRETCSGSGSVAEKSFTIERAGIPLSEVSVR